jgi:hypothetical protein
MERWNCVKKKNEAHAIWRKRFEAFGFFVSFLAFFFLSHTNI